MQCNAMQCNAMQRNAMSTGASREAPVDNECFSTSHTQCNAIQCNAMQCHPMACRSGFAVFAFLPTNSLNYKIARRCLLASTCLDLPSPAANILNSRLSLVVAYLPRLAQTCLAQLAIAWIPGLLVAVYLPRLHMNKIASFSSCRSKGLQAKNNKSKGKSNKGGTTNTSKGKVPSKT